ncbi:Alpha/beta hydrolase-3 [Melia azedarach]|uniref:Alpha/beta hydrolase-3 n=1 Tax=Melia azedarach TaxID=155640 RepID=A0ACC1X491_MELAZ|nr:Alpha/beta hydrolase-3 [Melia azedarach]
MSSDSTTDSYKDPPFILNADGTITRNYSLLPTTPATPDPNQLDTIAFSKDVPINPSKNTWARIFVPRQAPDLSSSTKLPLIVYFHGGGFVILSAATKMYHDLCSDIAVKAPAVVVSVDYRLAPEHRLPAAYDDGTEVLHWIKKTQDDWLRKYVDFSRCFLMGDSAGGNIAYHVGLRAASETDNLLPLKIRGLLLNQPYFGGVKCTESEFRMMNDTGLPLHYNHLMWELSLPLGVDRDHEYCNSKVGGGSKLLDQVKLLGWKIMVIGGFGDPLVDRQIELLKMMEQKGIKLESHFDGRGHRIEDFLDPAKLKALHDYVKNFVSSSPA